MDPTPDSRKEALNAYPQIFEDFCRISPLFKRAMEDYAEDFGDLFLPHVAMGWISRSFVDHMNQLHPEEIKQVFDLVEETLVHGDDASANLVAVSFLECLQNRDGESFDFSRIAKHLGAESIAFCKWWDEFTGVKTSGLY